MGRSNVATYQQASSLHAQLFPHNYPALLSFLIRSNDHVSNLATSFCPTAPQLNCVNSGRLGHCAARLGCDVCPLLFFPFSLGLRPLRFVTLLILSTPFLFSK